MLKVLHENTNAYKEPFFLLLSMKNSKLSKTLSTINILHWKGSIDDKGSSWNHRCQYNSKGCSNHHISFKTLENVLQFLEETKQNNMQFVNDNPTSAYFQTFTNPQIRNVCWINVTSYN